MIRAIIGDRLSKGLGRRDRARAVAVAVAVPAIIIRRPLSMAGGW
jgi:hypothetical protein